MGLTYTYNQTQPSISSWKNNNVAPIHQQTIHLFRPLINILGSICILCHTTTFCIYISSLHFAITHLSEWKIGIKPPLMTQCLATRGAALIELVTGVPDCAWNMPAREGIYLCIQQNSSPKEISCDCVVERARFPLGKQTVGVCFCAALINVCMKVVGERI